MIGPADSGTRDEILPELHNPGSGPVWNSIVKGCDHHKIRGQVRYVEMKARDSWVHPISFNPLGRSLACFCFSLFIPIISPLRTLLSKSDTIKRSNCASLFATALLTSSAFVITARRCRTSATVQSPCRPKGASETRDYPASPPEHHTKTSPSSPASSSRSSHLPSFR
ncbi:hypothetical protein BJX66DRAFT_44371 [Aspergillus keveii]|uniref:Uncharacterized protein n=1 Tax=Aspergillus keveii TaxID=714993 RepID=A0ABR4GH81_9EURO